MPTVLFAKRGPRPCASGRRSRPPRVKPRPNVPTAKPPIATALRHDERRCPAAERLLLLGRQRLAATLLAQRAARAEPEVEVVEDLGRLVRHASQCIACFARCPCGSSTSPTCTSDSAEEPAIERASRAARRAGSARADRGHAATSRTAAGRRSTSARRPSSASFGRPLLVIPGNHDIPYTFPARFTRPLAEFERAVGDRRAGPRARTGCYVVGLNSVRPWRHQSGGIRARADRADGRAAGRRARTTRCASSRFTTT